MSYGSDIVQPVHRTKYKKTHNWQSFRLQTLIKTSLPLSLFFTFENMLNFIAVIKLKHTTQGLKVLSCYYLESYQLSCINNSDNTHTHTCTQK